MWKRKWKTCNFRLFTCILKIKKSFGHIDFASKKKRAGELIKRRKLHGRFLQTVLVSPLVWAWEICSLLLTHRPLAMNNILVVNFSNMASQPGGIIIPFPNYSPTHFRI